MINEENLKENTTPIKEEQERPKHKLSSLLPATANFLLPYFNQPERIADLLSAYWDKVQKMRDNTPSGASIFERAILQREYIDTYEIEEDIAIKYYIADKRETPESIIDDVKVFLASLNKETIEEVIYKERLLTEFLIGHIDFSRELEQADGTFIAPRKIADDESKS
ncbi:MAG: hypothetical protein MJ066_06280, partial [Clostridia bacterium]|nr:hypothetical protein [Clostridia bacterium]